MSSGAEAMELHRTLQECSVLMAEIETKFSDLTARTQRTEVFITMQQALRVLWRLQSLFRRMGLPENVDEISRILNNLTRQMMYLYFASNLVWGGIAAGLTGGGFYGIAAGLIGLASAQALMLTPMEGY